VVRGGDESVGPEEVRRVGGAGGSDTRGVGRADGAGTGESDSNVGGGAGTTWVGVEVSASGGLDRAAVVDSGGAVGGAGIGLLGVWLGWLLGVALIGWVAVLMSAGTTVVVFSCSQAMVSPSDAIRVAANNPISSSTRRLPPGAEASGFAPAVLASIAVVDAVS